jgi:hypothetical protein
VTAQNANGESAEANQASATAQAAGGSCHVVYTVTTQWNVGFGTALNGWQFDVDVGRQSANQRIVERQLFSAAPMPH